MNTPPWHTLLLCGALALTGCSTATPIDPSTPASPAGTLSAPFSSLLTLSSEQTRTVYDATERAIAACMKTRGFSYTPIPYAPPSAENANNHLGDVAYATQHGYGLTYAKGADETGGPASNTGPESLSAAERAAYSLALLGQPLLPDSQGPTVIQVERAGGAVSYRSDSCVSVGTQAVRGDLREWYLVSAQVEDMVNEVLRRVQTDAAFVAMDTQWKECMATAGLGRNSRVQRLTELEQNYNTGRRSRADSVTEERRHAVADATCVQSSGAVDLIRSLMTKYEREVGDAHQAVLTRFAELSRESVDRAKEPA